MKKILLALVLAVILSLSLVSSSKAASYVLDFCKPEGSKKYTSVLYVESGATGNISRTYYTTAVPSLRVMLGVKSWLGTTLVSDTLHMVCAGDSTVR